MKFVRIAAFVGVVFTNAILSNAQTRESAILKIQNEQFENAEAELTALITKEPSNAEFYFLLGDCFLRQGLFDENERADNFTKAEAKFNEGISKSPKNPLNYAGLGGLAWFNHQDEVAKKQFDMVDAIINDKANKVSPPLKTMTYLIMAQYIISSDRFDESKALAYINNAKDPKNKDGEEYFITLGEFYGKQNVNDQSRSVEQFNLAIKANPTSARAATRKGVIYRNARNLDAAEAEFTRAINELDPYYAPAYRERAELYLERRKTKKAVEDYKSYLDLNQSCRVEQRYASFIYLTKDYPKAIEAMEKAKLCNDQNIVMHRLLARCYFEVQDFAKGISAMEDYFKVNMKRAKPFFLPDDYLYYGRLHVKAGRDTSFALENFKKAIEMNPNLVDAYGEAAAVCQKKKDMPQAIAFYQQKIQHSETPVMSDYYSMGQCYFSQKDYTTADSIFTIASSKYDAALFWRGKSLHAIDDKQDTTTTKPLVHYYAFIEKMVADSAQFEKNKKMVVEAYTRIAAVEYELGNLPCAATYCQKALNINPSYELANKLMAMDEIKKAVGQVCTESK
jgi:tetratricopeptide (TPR) repeat protein